MYDLLIRGRLLVVCKFVNNVDGRPHFMVIIIVKDGEHLGLPALIFVLPGPILEFGDVDLLAELAEGIVSAQLLHKPTRTADKQVDRLNLFLGVLPRAGAPRIYAPGAGTRTIGRSRAAAPAQRLIVLPGGLVGGTTLSRRLSVLWLRSSFDGVCILIFSGFHKSRLCSFRFYLYGGDLFKIENWLTSVILFIRGLIAQLSEAMQRLDISVIYKDLLVSQSFSQS